MKRKWIKKGDKVIIISGNDRGKIGEVLAKAGSRILVQGVNIRKKHSKASREGQKSQIVSIERPIDISNIALCTGNGKKIKLKVAFGQNRSKKLVYLDNGQEVIYRTLRKSINLEPKGENSNV